MTPDGETDSVSEGDDDRRRDVGFDEGALYVVVRSAVEDAILGVLGTLLLLGVALVIIWAGGVLAVSAASTPSVALGIAGVVFGFYVAATALEIVPPARDWF